MRISDWSSDVCSSDLLGHADHAGLGGGIVPMLRRIAAIGGAARDIDEATAALCAKMEDGETAEFGRGRKVDPHRPLPRGNPVVMTLVDRRGDRKSTRLNSSHLCASRLPSSA